jgi:hypothetical protein
MMKSQHTPFALSYHLNDSRRVAIIHETPLGHRYKLRAELTAQKKEDVEYYARLFASAPDLLDVCQAILTAFEGNHFPTHTQKHVLDGAKAAVAKAIGAA